jgi:hypothetical protein
MRYSCYQLTFDSDLELPELHAAPTSPGDAPADVTIRRGTLAPDGSACGERRGPCLWMGQDAMWLRVPGVARYQVEAGRRIVVDADPGVDDDSVRLFMLGSALGAVLAQRGHLVLHGNAVRVGDRALVCVGPSGAGKSTLAAALLQRGHDVLADDVVAIDLEGRALPGLPRIKLWQDAAHHVAVETEGLSRIRPMFDKFNLPLADVGTTTPVPIRWLYVLGTHAEDTVSITPVRGIESFKLLQENLYRARILRALSPLPEHLALCGRLASQVRIARVKRPDKGFALDALVDALLADAANHP